MKKKLFLIALMVALFACFLTISISAKDVSTGYFDLDGNEIVVPTYDDEGDSLVWIRSTRLDRAEQYGIELANGSTYYETNYEGATYYIFGSKTKNTISVDSDYAFKFKSGIGIDNNIIVMNLDGIAHSDGTGVKYFGLLIRNGVLQYLYIPSSIVSMKCKTNGKAVLLGDGNLSQVEFAPNSQMTELESYSFEGCGIQEIVLPENLTSIGVEAFLNCKSLKKVYIPRTVTSIAENAFDGVTDAEYYFTGSEETTSGWEFTNEIQYVNHCDVYYGGEHSSNDDRNCQTALNCEVCEKTLQEAMTHSLITLVDYANGYANEGVKAVACENQGCTVCNTTEELKALFTCLGYSAPSYGNGGIAIGFAVNNKAIAEYEELTGKTLKYGVFAVLKDKLGTNDVFGENGAVASGVINAEISRRDFAAFEIKIIGFADEQKDIMLAMGAYVLVTYGETTEYSYMQAGTPAENEKYHFVSYNQVADACK